MRKIENKKKQLRKSLLLCLTSSLFIGNSFASSTDVLDGEGLSNRMRASLQNNTAPKLSKEEVSKSNVPAPEYFVRCAIEMILESLRLQEMAKTNKGVTAATALNAGQDMFALGIGAFAPSVPAVKPVPPKKSDLVPPPAKEPEKGKEVNNKAAEEQRQREEERVRQEAEQRLEEERLRLEQVREQEELAKQQKQPDIQKDPTKNDLQPQPQSQPKNEDPSEKYKRTRPDYASKSLSKDEVDNAKNNFGGKVLSGLEANEIETYLTLRLNKIYGNDLKEAEKKKDYQSSSSLPPPPPSTGLQTPPTLPTGPLPPPHSLDLPPPPPPPPSAGLPPPPPPPTSPLNLPPTTIGLPPPPTIGLPPALGQGSFGFASASAAIKGCEHVDNGNFVPCETCLKKQLQVKDPIFASLVEELDYDSKDFDAILSSTESSLLKSGKILGKSKTIVKKLEKTKLEEKSIPKEKLEIWAINIFNGMYSVLESVQKKIYDKNDGKEKDDTINNFVKEFEEALKVDPTVKVEVKGGATMYTPVTIGDTILQTDEDAIAFMNDTNVTPEYLASLSKEIYDGLKKALTSVIKAPLVLKIGKIPRADDIRKNFTEDSSNQQNNMPSVNPTGNTSNPSQNNTKDIDDMSIDELIEASKNPGNNFTDITNRTAKLINTSDKEKMELVYNNLLNAYNNPNETIKDNDTKKGTRKRPLNQLVYNNPLNACNNLDDTIKDNALKKKIWQRSLNQLGELLNKPKVIK